MKTKILLLFLLWAGLALSQKNAKVIRIDLSKDKQIPIILEKNTYVEFILKDVNVFKITGFSTVKVENIDFKPPQWFTDQSKPTNTINPTDNVNALYVENTILEKKNKKSEMEYEYENLRSTIHNDFKSFFQNYQLMRSLIQLDDELNFIISDSIFIDSVSVIESSRKLYFSHFSHFEPKFEDYNKIESSIESLSSCYLKLNSDYKKFISLAKQLNADNFYDKDFLLASEIYKNISTSTDKISLKSKNGISLYKKILMSQFNIILPAQQLTEDVTIITPQLKNKKGEVVYSYSPIKFTTYGGWKINFSAGYFLSFIGNDNYTSYTNSLGNKEIAKGNTDKITNALGGLIHVYHNKPEWLVQPGFSFGISLADNASAGFYGGLSLFFLEKNRLITTFGYSFIKVKRINTSNLSPIMDSDRYAFINVADTEIRYDNVYKGAWFFGVTYNLYNNDKK
ncbi:hypothetical protein [Chryseobacterium sp.]|jgi:hypothetical protein|uniref:hypothetical protein n=1 Tax=Chryseobacterium sp. TaxID=1871047 RepID=UPI0028411BD6|nr:hypothetical protein [Chryseobacterium sp.]MDR3025960.1 hypothetical protein [Chryseobacterium sp.]